MPDPARAEIVVLSGPLAGHRYSLGDKEFVVGASPSCSLQLPDSGIAHHHCAIRRTGSGWRLIELSPGRGAFVNGLRTSSQELRDGDQLEIGQTDLVFRDGLSGIVETGARPALLRACSVLILFRALASASSESAIIVLEEQLIGLIGDLLRIHGGIILLGDGETALEKEACRRGVDPDVIRHLAYEGMVSDSQQALLSVPVYARQQLAGVIQVSISPADAEHAPEILSAVSVLAGAAIENVRELETLRNQNTLLCEQIRSGESGLIGESAVMRSLRAAIDRLAPRDTTVLILGESGTGKELVARALHRQSSRAAGPFVALNCAALTESLLESELFGHEKGAFTGAVALKKGKLELAQGGTVFLDEVGELAPPLQAKLLRVLQEHEFDRVGGTRTLRLDVRLIAATNRNLVEQVRKGAFREDLFHRLNVVALHTFPLRERREDILPLARHFLQLAATRHRRTLSGFSPEAEMMLHSYSWPGNVREVENAIERAAVLGSSETVVPEDLPDAVRGVAQTRDSSAAALEESVGNAKRETVMRAWRQAAGDYRTAAEILEMHPNSLLRLIRKLGLRDILRAV
jgi:two-component system response regulator HydG